MTEKFNPDIVVSDFDGTITKKVIGKKVVPSLISILRDNGFLDEDYSKIAKQLFNKYHSIEIDPNVSYEEKFKAMENWWKEHFKLLEEKGLNLEHIKEAVYHPDIQIREKFDEFLKILRERNIPLIVFSSSGLGTESIKLVFEKFNLPLDNVIVISNDLEFSNDGKFIGVDNVLHSMNKRLKDHIDKIENVIKGKEKVLLLGDSLHDPDMIEGMDFKKIFKVGFFLPKVNPEEELKVWKENYDMVLASDANFEDIIKLIE